MPIQVQCSQCQKKLRAPDAAAGKKVRCPECKNLLTIPKPPEPTDDDLVEPDDDTMVTEAPAKPVKKKRPDTELIANDDDTAVTASPRSKSKPARDDDEEKPHKRKRDDDDDDYDDEEEEERPRKKKKKKRFVDDYGIVRRKEAHRGVTVLILGIVAIVTSCLCPIVAWILASIALQMANTDVPQIERGTMDKSGAGYYTGGKICSIVALVLGLINCIAGFALNISDKL